MKLFRDKRGIEVKEIIGFAIAIAVMITILTLFIFVDDAFAGAVEYVKNFIRFGK